MKKIFNKVLNWKYFNLMIVIVLSLLYLSPFLLFYINGDDTNFHIANIKIYSEISIFDKIVPAFANNLGWGVGIFYPCLSHVLGGIFFKIIKIFNFSYVMAIKLVKSLIVILSGINMYFLADKLYKNKVNAMLSSLFYISSSYFLVDFYIRDALNESMLFIFMPLIFLSFLYLFNDNDNKRFYFLFIIGYVGMIYSHLVLTMWFTIFLIIFLLLYINKVFKKRYFFPLLIGTIVVIIFTATFTFPLIEHMIIGKWYIPVYKNVWVLPFKGFFFPDYYSTGNNLLFINFSYFIIILSFVGIYNLIFNNKFKYDKKFLLGILLVGIVSMALTSLNCFWNNVPSFFKSIQFSWRLVTFCIFCFSLFSASALDNIYNLFKKKYKYVMTLFLVVIIAIFTINNILKVNFIRVGNYNIDDPFISFDYYPINSIENIEYIKKMDSDSVSIIKGNGIVKIKENNTPYLKFKVSDIDDYVILELPRFYYLGYEITNDSGKKIKYTENKNGLIKINISKNGVYEVRYTGTIAYKVSVVLKSILIFILLILLIKFIIQKLKKY